MGERRAATAGLPWAAWASAMARSSWSGVAGPMAALTGSLDRRAAWPPRVRWPGRLTLAVARRAAWTACRRPGPGARRRIEVAVAWRRARELGRLRRGISRRRGRGPDALAARARCRPRPPLVRAPCPSRCPRPGSGRDAIPGPAPDDRPVPAAVAPGHWRAEGRDPGRPAPRARATRMWAWYGWPSPALSPPWPGRAVAPAPAGCAGPAAIVWGWPVRAGASQASSHVWVCRYRCGPARRPVPLVTRGPGSDGLAPGHPRGGRHGLAEWLAGRPVWPLRAAVSPHRPSEPRPDFFESERSSW